MLGDNDGGLVCRLRKEGDGYVGHEDNGANTFSRFMLGV